jgi:hypothetical protein
MIFFDGAVHGFVSNGREEFVNLRVKIDALAVPSNLGRHH